MRCCVCFRYEAEAGGRCSECAGGRLPTAEEQRALDAELDPEVDLRGQAAAMRAEGASIKEIAEELGIAWWTAKRWSGEPRARELREQGLTWREVGERLGVSHPEARRQALAAGYAPAVDARPAQVRELRERGLSWREVGKRMGVSHPTARKLARSAGTALDFVPVVGLLAAFAPPRVLALACGCPPSERSRRGEREARIKRWADRGEALTRIAQVAGLPLAEVARIAGVGPGGGAAPRSGDRGA